MVDLFLIIWGVCLSMLWCFFSMLMLFLSMLGSNSVFFLRIFLCIIISRGKGNRKRSWDSEAMRVALRKEFLDRLSMVLCAHRVRDFKHLGIPYVRANGATIYNSPPRPRHPSRTTSILPSPSELEPGRFTISRPVGNPG